MSVGPNPNKGQGFTHSNKLTPCPLTKSQRTPGAQPTPSLLRVSSEFGARQPGALVVGSGIAKQSRAAKQGVWGPWEQLTVVLGPSPKPKLAFEEAGRFLCDLICECFHVFLTTNRFYYKRVSASRFCPPSPRLSCVC